MTRPAVTIGCPTCGRKTLFTPENRWRPFCSQRCKSIDLGAWAAERYRIAGAPLDDGPGVGDGDERERDDERERKRDEGREDRERRDIGREQR